MNKQQIKKSRLNITAILLFAVIVCASIVIAWSSISSSAIANEEKDAGEVNSLPTISYVATPDASLIKYVKVNLKRPIPEGQNEYTCMFYRGLISFFAADDPMNPVFETTIDVEGLKTSDYAFDSFYINGEKKEDISVTISSDTQIEARFRTGILTANVIYYQGGEKKLEGYTVSLYDNNRNLVETKTTDANGSCTFYNVDPGKYDYTFIGSKEGWTDFLGSVSKQMLDPLKKCSRQYVVSQIENANYSMQSHDPRHGYFRYTSQTIRDGEVTEEASGFCTDITTWKAPWTTTEYTVLDDNSLRENTQDPTYAYVTVFTPVPKEGAAFKSWIADYNENGVHELKPGDTFSITSWETQKLALDATYQDAPIPAPEEVNAAAQTGDNTIACVIGLAVLAGLCTTVLVIQRKRKHI